MSSLSYPLYITYGSLTLTEDYLSIVRSAILSALQTELEERAYHPDYGLPRVEFESVGSLTEIMAICRQAIAEGLEGYPEVTYELRARINDDGLMELLVAYVVDETSDSLEVLI